MSKYFKKENVLFTQFKKKRNISYYFFRIIIFFILFGLIAIPDFLVMWFKK